MSFGKFLVRALLLSFPVALFWVPVLAITGYGIVLVVQVMHDEPIGLAMLAVLFWLPISALTSLLAIRGGLMLLKVTDGADIPKLFTMSWRIIRFNFPAMGMITLIFGLGVYVVFAGYLVAGDSETTIADQLRDLLEPAALLETPFMLQIGSIFGYCVAFAAMGVSMAAAAAMAVDNPPNHHTIWGVGAQFFNLFALSLLVMFLPFVGLVFANGGMAFTAEKLQTFSVPTRFGIDLYFFWASAAMYAGSALAYSIYKEEEAAKRAAEIAALAGDIPGAPKIDLAELRRSRMHN